MIVAAGVLAVLVALGAQSPVTPAEAEHLARSGQHQAALDAFTRLSVEHPDDLDLRMWIGRLQNWTGRPDLAETTYRAVLAVHRDHVEALTALGGVLVNRGRIDEALEVLWRAEHLGHQSGEVYAALGRGLRLAGQTRDAARAYDRAVTLSPTDPEIRLGLERVRRQLRHRVEAAFGRESYNGGLPSASDADMTVDARINDDWRIAARGQVQRRFGETDARGGAAVEWRASRRTTLRASALTAPDPSFLADADVAGEVEIGGPFWQPIAGVRYLHFPTASVWIIFPGITWQATDAFAVTARYYRSQTSFVASGRTVGDNSGSIAARLQVHARTWLMGGYARGYESFERLTADRLGRFRADTGFGGVRVEVPSGPSLAAVLEYQQRTGARRMARLTVGITQPF